LGLIQATDAGLLLPLLEDLLRDESTESGKRNLPPYYSIWPTV
jgi:hypothetical protein